MFVLDLIGTFECQACADLAQPGGLYCTSCIGWREWGELPTTLASTVAVRDEVVEAARADREVEADRALLAVEDRLTTLERARDRRRLDPQPLPRRFGPLLHPWRYGRPAGPPRHN